MKRILLTMSGLLVAGSVCAAPLRVLVLEFDDATGMRADAQLGGLMRSDALAARGVMALGRALLNQEGFALIDRRDYLSQVEQLKTADAGRLTPTKPTFLHAAQTLNADVVLRGSLQSFSSGKQVVNQGGYRTEFATLSVGVALEALDAVDGTIIAVSDGTAQKRVRQTESLQTVLGEQEVLDMFQEAVGNAVPVLRQSLEKRAEAQRARPTVRISIATSDDPALVELDGVLIGTTPIEGYQVYAGDHVLTVGKPGFRDVTKRVQFSQDVAIEVPMIRVELNADELKEVLEKMRLNVFVGEPGLIIHTISETIQNP